MAENRLRGELRMNEPLARYTSWRVGGPADRWYRPADLEDLCAFLAQVPATEPVFWLGLGSNVLIRDGGLPGTVILPQGGLSGLSLLDRGRRLRVEAGVPCARVARFAARHGLTGVEFLAGIPGTMGGALAMNAGAWGGETWNWVGAVETLNRRGDLQQQPAAAFVTGYRYCAYQAQENHSGHADSAPWFAAAHLDLRPGDGAAALERIRQLLEQRNQTQPTGTANCGSVFRNPPGHHAARLIESAGLKGFRVGGAQVSAKHANFIINTGSASATDLELLIDWVQEKVASSYGIQLRREVRVVGRPVLAGGL